MNFERGLGVKEAVNIGQRAIAPEITDFYELDPSVMVPDTRPNTKTTYEPKPRSVGAPRFIHSILEKIEDGTNEKRLRFYSVTVSSETIRRRVSDYKGLYLKFEDKTYKIP